MRRSPRGLALAASRTGSGADRLASSRSSFTYGRPPSRNRSPNLPRKVDHDERRLQVARVVEDLVHEAGVEALTIRDVARRAGCSTSIVSHYFASKLELLLFTHQMVRHRAEGRLMAHIEAGHDLITCLSTLLPIDGDGKRDWHTWFAFWGMAPKDPTISQEWLASTSGAHDIFMIMLRNARKSGEIKRSVNPERDASKIQVILNGISSLVLQDEASWPEERQRTMLVDMLHSNFGYRTRTVPE